MISVNPVLGVSACGFFNRFSSICCFCPVSIARYSRFSASVLVSKACSFEHVVISQCQSNLIVVHAGNLNVIV